MMLDFIVAPIFAEQGELVDILPRFNSEGQRIASDYILRQGQRTFAGHIRDWRVVLIEPNIGLGLWDRVALREEIREERRATRASQTTDWQQVGLQARIVLSDLSRAGEEYLRALKEAGIERN